MRTAARETLFKIIFASQFTEETDGVFKQSLYAKEKLDDRDTAYCDDLLGIIRVHKDEFTEILNSRSRLFPEARLFPADRSVLFIALAEILYRDDIPDTVSVNEAANIASKFSSEKSASFVSGILAEVIREKTGV